MSEKQKNGRPGLMFAIAIIGLICGAVGWGISYGTMGRDVKLGIEGNVRSIENRVDVREVKVKLEGISKKQDEQSATLALILERVSK